VASGTSGCVPNLALPCFIKVPTVQLSAALLLPAKPRYQLCPSSWRDIIRVLRVGELVIP
jgi:hypothetical protein